MSGTKAMTVRKQGNMLVYGEDLYDEYDEEAIDAEQEQREDESASEYDSLKEGKNYRRILPPPRGTKWGPNGKSSPFKKVYQHWIQVPGLKRKVVIVCPKGQYGEPCEVCKVAGQLNRSADPVASNQGYQMRANPSTMVNWINRLREEAGPLVGKYGKMIDDGIADLVDEVGPSLVHPVEGYDIIIVKRVKENRTSYKVRLGEQCPLTEDVERGKEWLTSQVNLDEYTDAPSEDEMTEILDTIEQLVSTASSGSRRRRKGSGGSSRGRRGRNVGDDIEDDEDDEYND